MAGLIEPPEMNGRHYSPDLFDMAICETVGDPFYMEPGVKAARRADEIASDDRERKMARVRHNVTGLLYILIGMLGAGLLTLLLESLL